MSVLHITQKEWDARVERAGIPSCLGGIVADTTTSSREVGDSTGLTERKGSLGACDSTSARRATFRPYQLAFFNGGKLRLFAHR